MNFGYIEVEHLGPSVRAKARDSRTVLENPGLDKN